MEMRPRAITHQPIGFLACAPSECAPGRAEERAVIPARRLKPRRERFIESASGRWDCLRSKQYAPVAGRRTSRHIVWAERDLRVTRRNSVGVSPAVHDILGGNDWDSLCRMA